MPKTFIPAITIDPRNYELLKTVASAKNETVSAFVRRTALEKAMEIIRNQASLAPTGTESR